MNETTLAALSDLTLQDWAAVSAIVVPVASGATLLVQWIIRRTKAKPKFKCSGVLKTFPEGKPINEISSVLLEITVRNIRDFNVKVEEVGLSDRKGQRQLALAEIRALEKRPDGSSRVLGELPFALAARSKTIFQTECEKIGPAPDFSQFEYFYFRLEDERTVRHRDPETIRAIASAHPIVMESRRQDHLRRIGHWQ